MSLTELQDCIAAAEHAWALHLEKPSTVRAMSYLCATPSEIGFMRAIWILKFLKEMSRGEWPQKGGQQ